MTSASPRFRALRTASPFETASTRKDRASYNLSVSRVATRGSNVKIVGALGLETLTPTTTDRRATPTADISNRRIEDPSTFSAIARARAEAAAHPRFGQLSVAAHSNADLADQLAFDYGRIEVHPMVDLTDEIAGTGPMKYTATGEPVTAESEARFNEYARNFQAASRALYNAERGKGTNSADIFDKLIALGDAQPAEFRAMLNWELRDARTA